MRPPEDQAFLPKSPTLIVFTIAVSIFCSEALVMLLLHYFPVTSHWNELFVDATLLVLLVSPVLYYFLFRPLVVHIREHQRIEDTLRENEEEQFKVMVRTALDGFWIVDMRGHFLEVNDAYCQMSGYSRAELLNMGITDVEALETPEETSRRIKKVMETGEARFETAHRCKDGHLMDIWVSTQYSSLHGGQFYCFLRDITDRKLAEKNALHLAHHDTLTGLPNRAMFTDRFQQALAQAKRGKSHMAVMFLDLDKFKPVNDTLGHDIGDLLLKEAAKRMQNCVRESDTVARMGGDEFIVLLPSVESGQDALLVAEKIRHALNQPFELAGHSLYISSSIGVAVYPEHGSDEKQLLKNADTAMYYAKEGGRDTVKLFSAATQENSQGASS